jgi:hypothetical protein
MLRRTFCHLPRVGLRTESRLWDAGVTSWDQLSGDAPPGYARAQIERLRQGVATSEQRIAAGDASAFTQALPSNQQWRLFSTFRDEAAYLDIETTGLGAPGDKITTIALYDGQKVRHFVHGRNLDEFPDVIRRYGMLVTYNGKCFDVPFIERYFRIRLEQAHLDLRYILRQLGFGGGLKGCERALGVDGLDGFHAVILWREWERHRRSESLETLLAYNVEDTINLEALMVLAFNRLVRQTPFASLERVADGKPPSNPFRADPRTVARVLARGG